MVVASETTSIGETFNHKQNENLQFQHLRFMPCCFSVAFWVCFSAKTIARKRQFSREGLAAQIVTDDSGVNTGQEQVVSVGCVPALHAVKTNSSLLISFQSHTCSSSVRTYGKTISVQKITHSTRSTDRNK